MTKEMNPKETIQFHPPSTTAVSGEITACCSLLPEGYGDITDAK